MFKEERYDKILEILEEKSYISAVELSEKLYVSMPTIRRDLAELQNRDLIVRSHGGAKKIQSEHTVAPLNFRKTLNSSEKRRLCYEASQLVMDNDVVFIDGSSTTLQMADFLDSKKNITVITNGIMLATLLVNKGIKTYCTGGEISKNSLAHYGSFSEEFIQRFNIDILFFSCHGISEKGILTDPSLPETHIRKIAINQSKKKVFLCGKSKFSLSAPYNLIPIQELDYIITTADEVYNFFEKESKKIIFVDK